MSFPDVSSAFWNWTEPIQFNVVVTTPVDYEAVDTPENQVFFDGVIEPLKAKAAQLNPEMARHSLALRDIVASRGWVDPGALVLRVQGLRALYHLRRILRLLVRGKINPIKTMLGTKTAAAEAAGGLLGKRPEKP